MLKRIKKYIAKVKHGKLDLNKAKDILYEKGCSVAKDSVFEDRLAVYKDTKQVGQIGIDAVGLTLTYFGDDAGFAIHNITWKYRETYVDDFKELLEITKIGVFIH